MRAGARKKAPAAPVPPLAGCVISAVRLRPFDDGRGGTACRPEIILADGRVVSFTVQETEVGEYGVRIDIEGASSGLACHDCGVHVESANERVVRCANCARYAAL